MEFSGRKAELKRQFMHNRGYWNDFWDALLAVNPDFFEAYLVYSSLPWTPGVLEPKIKEFIYVAIDVATTHLYEPGLRIHFQNALKHGAAPEELLEVIILCGGLGAHTFNVGIPILQEELDRAGRSAEVQRLSPLQHKRLRERFEGVRGHWAPFWDAFIDLDPKCFEAYQNLTAAPWRSDVLTPKVKELLYVAITASVTHLYAPALRVHIRQALYHGATAAEIMEVFQLTSVLGMHSCTLGVPALLQELEKAGRQFSPEP